MKRLVLAKSAGFCYGVRRAVAICEEAAKEYGKCVTLGPVIHNKHVTDRLEKEGVYSISDIAEVSKGDTVIIRAHGVRPEELEILEGIGANIIDATCPDVKKIHNIVSTESLAGRFIVIIGERKHPEVVAIGGWSKNFEVFETPQELQAWLKIEENVKKPISVVYQTTNSTKIYNSCNEILKKECTNIKTFDTICGATYKRQQEAAEISKTADVMIVVGDMSSANSLRLADVCRENCPKVFFVQSASDIDLTDISNTVDVIGITAGASAPSWVIKEVTNKMMSLDAIFEENENEEQGNVLPDAAADSEQSASVELLSEEKPVTDLSKEDIEPNDAVVEDAQDGEDEDISAGEESFEEMLFKSIKTLRTGEKVSGIVTSITASEVSVDLGTKQSGYIPISEFMDGETVDINDVVKIGDTIEAFVMRVNDVEGMVMLSKKRLDAIKNWDVIEAAKDEKATVEGVVIEENKGGIVVSVKGIRVFVPASQIGIPRSAPIAGMIKKTVKLRIREVNASRRRVVGSIRDVQADERRIKAESVWADIEVGKHYQGVVKSMTSYGVFVDIGGVDGMIHISELSWTRIKQPSDVMSVGDEVEVYVLSFDKEARQISLGYKKSQDNPWIKFSASNYVGDVINVKVVKMMPFGAFAEIQPGVDGLIHISQIANHRIGLPSEVLSVGQEVDVKITEIDSDRKKVSLSIRALLDSSDSHLVPERKEELTDEVEMEAEAEVEDDSAESEALEVEEQAEAAQAVEEEVTEQESETAEEE